MTLPTFGDASKWVQEILLAADPTLSVSILEEQADGFTKGLSVGASGRPLHMVFVQEIGGQTVDHIGLDEPRIEVVTYSYGKPTAARQFARSIQRVLYMAWVNQTVTASGHIRYFRTEVRPYVQQLAGIPASIVRTSATYSLGHRSRVA